MYWSLEKLFLIYILVKKSKDFIDTHRLTMRPSGVVSKKLMGARKIFSASWMCMKRAALEDFYFYF